MNDYIVGGLMRGRQADYMREVERDELAAQLHDADAGAPAAGTSRTSGGLIPTVRRLSAALAALVPGRVALGGHRP